MLIIKNIGTIVSVLIIGAFWFLMFKKFFIALKNRKKSSDELPIKELPLTAQKATVLSKRSDIKYKTSIKLPSHSLIYFVTFSVNGTVKELEVPKNVFETVTENETATLVTSDGFFYSFE